MGIKTKKSGVVAEAQSGKPIKKKRRKKKEPSNNGKTYSAPESTPEEEEEDRKARVAAGVEEEESSSKSYSTVDDIVTKKLAKCEKPREMAEILKSHKSFKYINQEAFKRTVKAIKDTPAGLIRMRFGNLLRGAIRKMSKPKK